MGVALIKKSNAMLKVKSLKKYFPVKKGFFHFLKKEENDYIKAVDGISFDVKSGETIGIAGESGCGKTTSAKTIIRLYYPTEGEILFKGNNISYLKGKELHQFRKMAQMIFQDPYESINPRFTVYNTLKEPLNNYRLVKNKTEERKKIIEVLKTVKLEPPKKYLKRYPYEMSGGERQRVAIARALILKPKLLIADEPVSMLDVSIRAGVLNLLKELIYEMQIAAIYISHDLSLIKYMCDRVAIMYRGRFVEFGTTKEVIAKPLHPYSYALLAASPVPDPDYKYRIEIIGNVSDPINSRGCRFAPRCKRKMAICSEEPPRLKEITPGHYVECHLY